MEVLTSGLGSRPLCSCQRSTSPFLLKVDDFFESGTHEQMVQVYPNQKPAGGNGKPLQYGPMPP